MVYNKLGAFTIAEVTITLMVIGTIEVITIATSMPTIQQKVLSSQTKIAQLKLTQVLEQMALQNKIGPHYDSAEKFTYELSNYLKISKTCTSNHFLIVLGTMKLI